MPSRRLLHGLLVLAAVAGCKARPVTVGVPPPRLRLVEAAGPAQPPVLREVVPEAPERPRDTPVVRPSTSHDPELYRKIVAELRKRYYRDLPNSTARRDDLDGLMEQLDPYTKHVPSERFAEVRKTTVGRFGGIGVQVAVVDDQLTVVSPLVDTPAYRAGIMAGDRIVTIDGRPTEDMHLDEAVQQMMGPPGSVVHLGVIHPYTLQPVSLPVIRDTIKIGTVVGEHRRPDGTWTHVIDRPHGIAYVRLTAFTAQTGSDFRRVVGSLVADGTRGLVLDLRYNPGGVVRAAVDVADCFLDKGVVVSIHERGKQALVFRATSSDTWRRLPVVVLVNRYSASASEIVAAALQDHGRAMLVGERTYGKGSVQRFVMLGKGQGALKMTTALYRSPSGRSFQHEPGATTWGIEPDVPCPLGDVAMGDLARWRRERDVVGGHAEPDLWRRKDSQLVRAVSLLKVRLTLAR